MEATGMRQGYQRSQAGIADTLLLPPYELQMHEVLADNGERRSFIVPFSARPQWSMDWDGMLWFGKGDEYRIHRLAYDGDTVAAVEGVARDAAVTREESDAARSALRDRLGASTIGDGEWLPSRRPAFDEITVSRDGQLWVGVTESDGQRSFDVFDFEGRQLAVVRFEGESPQIDQVVIRNGHVYGIIRDDLYVPYLVRYRISE
jgi:sugar lactone lactonase YvrE